MHTVVSIQAAGDVRTRARRVCTRSAAARRPLATQHKAHGMYPPPAHTMHCNCVRTGLNGRGQLHGPQPNGGIEFDLRMRSATVFFLDCDRDGAYEASAAAKNAARIGSARCANGARFEANNQRGNEDEKQIRNK